eukprot:CAMPEP_0168334766 /NCGR_PEP_ID=MMETSP0213-20121227/10489_1 /TAXON_ID=151035 /ORGANISM="Euplotes harpa, Strain FSP1.4" /LENGTH=277 /DNA_ID=CAMNT_0008339525 /DNA_START=33 /DNA_END=869 /DNA_ORIENTATION=-
MLKNKFEKQPSGMLSLNFDATPVNKGFDNCIKDYNEQFSFTLKSRDDPFGNNQALEDFGFSNFALKGDKTGKNQNTSPMTRRQRAKELERLKEVAKNNSPDRFNIDLDKLPIAPAASKDFLIQMGNAASRLQKAQQKQEVRAASDVDERGYLASLPKSRGQRVKRDMETTKKRAINEDPLQNKRRKNKNQVKMLEAELEANPHWTNEDMIKIAKKTGLSKSQVYKWNWDQKKKLNIMPSKVYVVQLPSELIDPKTGQIVLKSVEDMKKLKTLNIQHS